MYQRLICSSWFDGGAEIARPDIARTVKSAPYRKGGHRETWQPFSMSPSLV